MWFKNIEQEELILIVSILCFLSLSIVFLIATFLSRLITVKRVKQEREIYPVIENYINEYLFDICTLSEVLDIFNTHPLCKTTLFKKALLKSTIVLHSEFRGEYSKKMEVLYVESGLINYSINKLKSRYWGSKVEAIRELADMNCFQFANNFERLCMHKHPIVRSEALVALIKTKGIEALHILESYKGTLNDWMQVYIINTLKKKDTSNVPDLKFLLSSSRTPVVVLGLRIIAYYNDSSYVDYIKALLINSTEKRIKDEAYIALSKIESMLV